MIRHGDCLDVMATLEPESVVRPEPEPAIDVAAIETSSWQAGRSYENQRLRHYFLGREEYGLATFADVVNALWPEED